MTIKLPNACLDLFPNFKPSNFHSETRSIVQLVLFRLIIKLQGTVRLDL